MTLVTSLFLGCVIFIMASVGRAEWLDNNVPDTSVLRDEKVQYGLASGLIILGCMSILCCFNHWKRSIQPLYNVVDETPETEVL